MKKIILYGAGNYCRLLLKNTQLEQYEIVGIVDGDSKKWGTYIEQFLIGKPEDIFEIEYEEILIAAKMFQGIAERLVAELQVPEINILYCDFDAMQIHKLADSGLTFESSAKAAEERRDFRRYACETIQEGLLFEAFRNGEFAGYDGLVVVGEQEAFDVVKQFVESVPELQVTVKQEKQIASVEENIKYVLTDEDYREQMDFLVNTKGCKRKQCLVIPLFDVSNTVLV